MTLNASATQSPVPLSSPGRPGKTRAANQRVCCTGSITDRHLAPKSFVHLNHAATGVMVWHKELLN
jgi:hypothetical protein